jgi:hypothetical protein
MNHKILEPFKEARKAFLSCEFAKCDQILPGLDSLVVLGLGAKAEIIDAFVQWARKNRPCDMFLTEDLQ